MIPKLPCKIWFSNSVAPSDVLDKWYTELEVWHKQVFENAVEVYGIYHDGIFHVDGPSLGLQSDTSTRDSHKALLINITRIKETSGEDILRDFVENGFSEETMNKAIRFLADKSLE